MYQNQWNSSFDMNVDETHVNAAYYLSTDRSTPGPPDPYLGHFAVSETGNISLLNNGVGSPYFMDMAQMAHHDTLLMRNSPCMSVDSGAHDVQPGLPTPTLSSNDQTDSHDDRESPAESRHQSSASSPAPPPASPKRIPFQGVVKSKKKTLASSKKPSTLRVEAASEKEIGEHDNCHGKEVPPKISKDCPDEERFLFECRWENRNNKGQMWDNIQREYTQKFGRTELKEALQMKYKRGRSRYIDWLPEDVSLPRQFWASWSYPNDPFISVPFLTCLLIQEEILRQAWEKMEKERYKTLLAVFHEKGGSRNMFLSPSDIEYKVTAELGLEEELYLNGFKDLGLRRRCRHWKPKKHATTLEGMMVQPYYDEETVLDQVHESRDTNRMDGVIRTSIAHPTAETPVSLEPPVTKKKSSDAAAVKARKPKKPSDKPRKSVPSKLSRRSS